MSSPNHSTIWNLAGKAVGVIGFAVLGTMPSTGCVERILQVRSDPPGAEVYVNGDKVGTTPCDHEFTFYGTVGVTLRGPGLTSRRELVTLSPPWYEFFPLDLITDLLLPFTIRDVHPLHMELRPSKTEITPAVRRELDGKAEEMRNLLTPPEDASTDASPEPPVP